MDRETQEEVAMNEEIRDRLDKLDKHLEKQDDHLMAIARTFHEHELVDRDMHAIMKAHVAEHEANRKFRILLWISVIGAVMGSFALVTLEYLKHHIH